MKRLLIASIFCVAAQAQDKAPSQLVDPVKLLEFPTLANPTSAVPAHTLDLTKQVAKLPTSLEFRLNLNPSGVCSVPLLDAHADANDPGLAIEPGGAAAPMPRVNVPAPACAKGSR
jgi:hypothetical protein